MTGDGGRSLLIDMKGEDVASGIWSFEDANCLISYLEMPDASRQRMLQTSSQDGRQSDDWDDIEASWKYHPDNGLDITMELAE